jgi:hypothetical protein
MGVQQLCERAQCDPAKLRGRTRSFDSITGFRGITADREQFGLVLLFLPANSRTDALWSTRTLRLACGFRDSVPARLKRRSGWYL